MKKSGIVFLWLLVFVGCNAYALNTAQIKSINKSAMEMCRDGVSDGVRPDYRIRSAGEGKSLLFKELLRTGKAGEAIFSRAEWKVVLEIVRDRQVTRDDCAKKLLPLMVRQLEFAGDRAQAKRRADKLKASDQGNRKYRVHSQRAPLAGNNPFFGIAGSKNNIGKCGGGKADMEGKCGGQKTAAMSAPLFKDARVVPVYYGTNRKPVEADSGLKYFSGKPDEMHYGMAQVNIPPDHKKGKLERPLDLYLFTLTEDPADHVMMLAPPEVLSEQEFFNSLEQRVDAADDKSAFVFIHGFNVTFEDSIIRTGQLAYDLAIKGPAITFSWPSEGKMQSYFTDARNNDVTIPELEKFLVSIKERTGVANMHVLAHSMGNRAFTAAMRDIARQHNSPYFNQVVLAAPDIDAEVFRQQIAPEINGIAKRITLYASEYDKALMVSEGIRDDYSRAGQAGEGLVVVDGIDTVDASGINAGWLGLLTLGHSDYGDELIDDIYHIVRSNLAPEDRNLDKRSKDGRAYWVWK